MGIPVELIRPRFLTRGAAVGLLASLAAGCSSDTLRFADHNPFSNPFASQPQQTGSIPTVNAYPTARVQSQPLSGATVPPSRPVAAQPLPPVGTMPARRSPQGTPLAAGSYAAPTGGIAGSSPPINTASGGGWSAIGGTVVAAQPGDTPDRLSNRYGVPADAVIRVNNLSGAPIAPGQQITIPVYNVAQPGIAAAAAPARPARLSLVGSTPAAAPRMHAEAAPVPPRPVPSEAAAIHVVKPGETLTSIAQAYGTTRPKLAQANGIDEWSNVRIGQHLMVGSAAPIKHPIDKPVAAARPSPAAAKPVQLSARPVAPSPQPVQTADASVRSIPVLVAPPRTVPAARPPLATIPAKPQVAAYADENAAPAETASVPVHDEAQPADPAAPQFRWPVKGRVIQSFGQNADGINISVPEGTEVRAAENGVVAYAGNELKGYGNLVLIRHANGYVTAYAHARDLSVKRGDTVKRGQVIATAGQTGNVTSPQLLFELRKGATPVDPRLYLSGT